MKRGPAVCGCGRTGYDVQSMEVHLNEAGSAWTSGTLRCNSGWLCPVCAPQRARERQGRMAEVYDTVTLGLKGLVPMVTLTIRHRQGMALADLRQTVQDAWKAVRQGAPWARLKKRYGVLGTITAPEVTWSAAFGWHFHLHVAVPCLTGRKGALQVGSWIIDRYIRYVRAAGYDALSKGQDVTLPASPEAAANYLAKGVTSNADISWELAGGANKRGRSDSMHPFDILEASPGDDRMAALWREYAVGMKGARSCVISAALAKRLGLDEADDIEEPVVDGNEKEEAKTLVGELPAYVWNAVMKARMGSAVLAIVENDGPLGWGRAERQAYRIAGFDPPGANDVPPPPLQPHAPTAEAVARHAISEAYQVRGRKGEALRRVLDRERGRAVAMGRPFAPPNLRAVLQIMSA